LKAAPETRVATEGNPASTLLLGPVSYAVRRRPLARRIDKGYNEPETPLPNTLQTVSRSLTANRPRL